MTNRRTSGRRRLGPKMAAVTAAVLTCLGGVGVLATSGVASAGTNSFTFSGGLTGTLKLVPSVDCGGSAGGETQLDDIAGKLKGSKSDQWTLIVIAPKNGTFTIKPASTGVTSETVTLETPGKNEALSWDATKGSITLKGSTGSLNVTVKGTTGGASGSVKIKGSWDCPPS
jgi:hypothetical protein